METFLREFPHSLGNNNSAEYKSNADSEFISHAEVCMYTGWYFMSRIWPTSLYHMFQHLQCLSVHALSICMRSVMIGKCLTAFTAPRLSVPPLCGRYALESVSAINICFPLWYTTSVSYCSMRRSMPCTLHGVLCSGFFTIISSDL